MARSCPCGAVDAVHGLFEHRAASKQILATFRLSAGDAISLIDGTVKKDAIQARVDWYCRTWNHRTNEKSSIMRQLLWKRA